MGAAVDGARRRTEAVSIPSVKLRKPYLLFLGDAVDRLEAKTAFGLRDWVREDVTGQWRLTSQAVDLGLDDLNPAEAVARGAQSLVIGVAPAGGDLPDHWIGRLAEAAALGLDIISGLHVRLAEIDVLRRASQVSGAALVDIRRAPGKLTVGTGAKRSGRRLLTVGVDCAVGKKYTALSIAKEMRGRGWDCDFRATGQTGILIAGGGIPIDAVISDFISGAAESLSPDADPAHWDIIEGQGAIFHPSYAGVTTGLIHGSQPDAMVLCIDATRAEIDGCPGFSLPEPGEAMRRYLELARLTNKDARFVGISAQTIGMADEDVAAYLAELADAFSMPAIDPMRTGAASIVDGLE